MPKRGSGKPPVPTPRQRAILAFLAARPGFFIYFTRAGKVVLGDGHGLVSGEVKVTRRTLGGLQQHGWVHRAGDGTADHWVITDAGRRALEGGQP
jgi:hypothetical protein